MTTTTPADNFGLVQFVNVPDTGPVTFGYDGRDLIVPIIDGLNHETTTVRDDAGRPTATVDPLRTTVTLTGFDPNARVSSTTNGLNQITTYTFDGMRALTGNGATNPLS